jgi:hypothetical protein
MRSRIRIRIKVKRGIPRSGSATLAVTTIKHGSTSDTEERRKNGTASNEIQTIERKKQSAVPDGRRHSHFPEMWQF